MKTRILLLSIVVLAMLTPRMATAQVHAQSQPDPFSSTSKPFTRWWWFASVITEKDVRSDLDWLKANGFGGVEIQWMYPLNRRQNDTIHYTPRQEWLSPEWTSIVAYTKRYADSIGLGCDYTFGSLWPFGDSRVPREEATRNFTDTSWRQDMTASWEYPKTGYIIDHLMPKAFEHYADRMLRALPRVQSTIGTAYFCDSWEVETRQLWTPGFDSDFQQEFGYDIRPYMDSIYAKGFADERYDYMKLLSKKTIGFYRQFTGIAHSAGVLARVQCAGAPCDMISAYAGVDIPETEAMLYEPDYAKIVASAAALSGRKVVSSETFTCLYGWPRIHHKEEQTADLKLVADALFANGVNHIIWHGKPLNPAGTDTVISYTVHVGPSGSLAPELPQFNAYMEKVSSAMKRGTTYSDVAAYLPTEDAWEAGELPKAMQFIWSWGAYEMRYVYTPEELKGYHPLWINGEFLQKAEFRDGVLHAGDAEFTCLYMDVKFVDRSSLKRILGLAEQGLPVCLKRDPSEPGKIKSADFQAMLAALKSMKNVSSVFAKIHPGKPFVRLGVDADYWCRKAGDEYYIFIAHPKSRRLKYPISYGQAFTRDTIRTEATFTTASGTSATTLLEFKPYQSLLLRINSKGEILPADISFIPKTPVVKVREKRKEAWEVE
ncbi:MAG TPA: glycosyl hydrolase [Bacteroidota bacterium]|nr:glycosyl hydrolase [Bacteroidota bacterium]